MGSNESNVGQSTTETKSVPSADKSVESSSKDRAEAEGTRPMTEIEFPANIAEVVGRKVTLECRGRYGSDKIQWQFLAVGSTTPLYIVDSCKVNSKYIDAYAVDETDNACNLRIDSVTIALAGTYTCTDISRRSVTASSELIVLAAEPACKTSADGQKSVKAGTEVTFTCSVQYSGAAAPVMQFLNEFEQIMPVNSVIFNSSYVETSIVAKAGIPTIRPYTAKTYFNTIVLPPLYKKDRLKLRDLDVPDYVYSWTSKPMVVSP